MGVKVDSLILELRKLHRPEDDECAHDGQEWPCLTARIFDRYEKLHRPYGGFLVDPEDDECAHDGQEWPCLTINDNEKSSDE